MAPKERKNFRLQLVKTLITEQCYNLIVAERAADQVLDTLTTASVVKHTSFSS